MKKKQNFIQFAPDTQNPNAAGSYGWGFESNGFRIVMYGPPEYDTPPVQFLDKLINKQRRIKGKQELRRKGEHGPAHVHVIDVKTNRESKFEFIEDADGNHFSILLEQNGNGRKPLKENVIKEAKKVVNEYTNEFIQLWREFYASNKLSNFVTRISEKFPEHYERAVFNNEGREMITLTPAEGLGTTMSFEDYVNFSKPAERKKH